MFVYGFFSSVCRAETVSLHNIHVNLWQFTEWICFGFFLPPTDESMQEFSKFLTNLEDQRELMVRRTSQNLLKAEKIPTSVCVCQYVYIYLYIYIYNVLQTS